MLCAATHYNDQHESIDQDYEHASQVCIVGVANECWVVEVGGGADHASPSTSNEW